MKSISIFTILFFVAFHVVAQKSGNYNRAKGNYDSDNNVTSQPQNLAPIAQTNGQMVALEVKVLSNQKADAYVAIFNLTQMGKTVEETNQLLTDRYNGFAEELQSIGIPKSSIYLDVVSFVPLYEYEVEKKIFTKTHNEVPRGFEMQQNVHIKYTDAAMMAQILAVAARYEIYDLVKVDYAVDNQEAIYIEMRKKATVHLVKKIELFVDKLGVDLESGYRVIGENKRMVSPVDRYSSYNAFSNVSLGGSQEKGKVVDMYKPKTMFYDQLKADDFDIVVNPAPLEPALQFMYTMKVQITVNDPAKPSKEHIWLTPDGDLVPVKP